jgi:putative acetyltransferase
LQGIIRPADPLDAPRLYDIRRTSILALAASDLSGHQARHWADARYPTWIERVLLERDVWVFQARDLVVGWASVTADMVNGLYTDPNYARRGVGSRLLEFVEAELRGEGWSHVRLEASRNAESFYLKRGYEPTGGRPRNGALPMEKPLVAQTAVLPPTSHSRR